MRTPSDSVVPHDPLAFWQAALDAAPDAVAVQFEANALTYASLDRQANRLAHTLRAHGVRPDDRVGICLERSLHVPVAMLAVLKAGAAYLPLDPRYPQDRLSFMADDGAIRLLLTQSSLAGVIPFNGTALLLDRDPLNNTSEVPFTFDSHPDLLAYVIYTSGSTGKPKGVALGRRALANLIHWQRADSRAGAATRSLQYTPLSFDVHFQEFFGTWASGGTLVMVPDELRLDPARLLPFLQQERIERLFLPFIALQSLAEVARSLHLYPSSLREIITAGEQLQITPAVADLFEHLTDCTLHNHYGPSETHVVTAYTLTGAPGTWPTLPPIGTPLPGISLHLFDEKGEPAPEGELFIGGVALARGYHNRPELTAERFVTRDGQRLYRTGDLARQRPDGNYDYLGRIDGQVKIRGHRVELGEVEAALSTHAAVSQAAVTALEDAPGLNRLVAYLVPRGEEGIDISELRRYVVDKLPDYMVPAAFVTLTELPRTPSGKVDRRALPQPARTRPELAQEYVEPKAGLQEKLAIIWCELLRLDRVGSQDNFFELGGNSLLSVQVLIRLRHETSHDLSIATFFRFPSIGALADFLEHGESDSLHAKALERRQQRAATGAVAIVGMAGRFPGAATVEKLWRNLCGGVESITLFNDDELHPSVPAELRRDPTYIRARGVLDNVETFDAGFFGIAPREAELMDPQHRLFLEIAWESLEHAGHVPQQFGGLIGVYAGCHNNSYRDWAVAKRPELVARLGEFQTMVANEKDYLATRAAYALNLTGPALSLYTACSTSLVAVVQAVHSLLARQCDLALAGGVAIGCPQQSGYLYQEGAMLSPDGHCRPFDERAQGTIFSNGAGIVALRRLEDALADGDQVYAVIKGAALNNDGARKMSFSAPAAHGQAEVIALAHAMADVSPETIGFVEAHGTATPLGDPVEVEALTQVFRERTSRANYCALGSVKSNFGHLLTAAGVTGLIKAALALRHELIPPTLHFQKPNPRIDWSDSPFFVNAEPLPWPRSESPRRAAVSSFGVGGTNAHVVLEEAPAHSATAPADDGEQLLIVSARNEAALNEATRYLAEHLARTEQPLADVAFTLQEGRRAFAQRRFVVARTVADAAAALAQPQARPVETRHHDRGEPDVVFLFPGQGAQHVNMGRELYQREPVFRTWLDRSVEILRPMLGHDLRAILYPQGDANETLLDETRFAQPALFAVGYALAKLWQSWGVMPKAMLGHSVGEFVAACLADVFSLEDGLRLVANRAALMQAQPRGVMLSVRAPAETVATWLEPSCAIASINGGSLCVVSGPEDAVARMESTCDREQVVHRRLRTSHAFHSPMMEPAVEPFAEVVRSIKLSPPRIPILSTVTADWLTPEQATDANYWAGHLRATVRFGAAISAVWKEPGRVLLEVGPRATLATLARQQATDRDRQVAIASLESAKEGKGEWAALLQGAGRLWLLGAALDWPRLHAAPRRRVPLPTYPFQRQRCWIEPPETTSAIPSPQVRAALPSPPMETIMPSRKPGIRSALRELLEDSSGIDLQQAAGDQTFLELGLDSLFLTQAALSVQRKFQVPVTFRQLLEDLSSLDRLADYLDERLPPDAFAPTLAAPRETAEVPVQPPAHVSGTPVPEPPHEPLPGPSLAAAQPIEGVQQLIAQQLALMAKQLEVLGHNHLVVARPPDRATPPTEGLPAHPEGHRPGRGNGQETVPQRSSEPASTAEPVKPFGAQARITTKQEGLTSKQKDALAELTRRYNERTRQSKERTQAHRAVLADPRVVSGFRPETKDIVYPIVVERSQGSRLWDVDGNEYIDLTCGFGSNFFGYAPKFIVDAVTRQLHQGYEIGPQHPLAGEVATRIAHMVGLPRVVFCNTGSEAVLGAVRLARTTTGRNTVALFNGSYHGINDEVIVRAGKNGRSLAAAAGIPGEAVANVLILDYGSPEALKIIEERGHDLAAVLVEPVQSRHPDLQPREFLHEVRRLTEKAGAALIFDEVITGFRLQAGGAQAYFGVRADLATYGKVVGGGMPIGVIAGSARFMDGLDGGGWQYGDASFPEAGVTYFAGTFVRHPLALAAADAVLRHLQAQGPALYDDLNARTTRLVHALNALFTETEAPVKIERCGSLFKILPTREVAYAELLHTHLRLRGIHVWDARPCFLTTAHTDEDVTRITQAFREAVAALQEADFYPTPSKPNGSLRKSSTPPVQGARLGKDALGKAAWFAPDPKRPGKYVNVGEAP